MLGDHLFEKSEAVEYVDIRRPHNRNRRLKDHEELLQIQANDPDSEDIFKPNVLNNYYPERPDELEDVCFHDFIAQYSWDAKDSKGKRVYRQRLKARLVDHILFDPNKEEEKESYYYSLIVLFVPFRDESSLLSEGETAEQAYNRLLHDNEECIQYHERLQAIRKAQSTLKQINEARKSDRLEEESKEGEEEENVLVVGEAKSAMEDMADMNANPTNDIPLDERVDMLNADQRRVYDKMHIHLLHQKEHDDGNCQCDNFQPLTMFVSGVGGTGKSFLIEAIKALTDTLWLSEDLKCGITAPTWLAAFNIKGVTIHRLLQLPVEHEGKTAGYWSLSKATQKVMKTTLHNLKLLVIDEVSMVSSLNLTYINMRLQEVFGEHGWFGGKNVLFVGDLLQLQPVNGNPVFETISNKALKTGLVVWGP